MRAAAILLLLLSAACGESGPTASGSGFPGCGTLTPYPLATAVSGALQAGDCTTPSGAAIDYHSFSTAAPRDLALRLEATGFTGQLTLYDRGGTPLAGAAGESGIDAYLARQVAPGEYVIGVTSRGSPGTGAYRLVSSTDSVGFAACLQLPPLPLAQTLPGALAATDCPLPQGRHRLDVFEFTLAEQRDVAIGVRAQGFTPDLRLYTRSGAGVAQHVDVARQTAFVGRQLAPGHYVVAVTSVGEATGAYALTRTDETAGFRACPTTSSIQVGATAAGTWSAADCQDPFFDRYTDYYVLRVEQPTTVSLTLTSPGVVPQVEIFTRAGTRLAEQSDVGPAGVRLTHALPPGTYVVAATAFTRQATGGYTLAVR